MNDGNNAPQELTIRVVQFGIMQAIILSAAND